MYFITNFAKLVEDIKFNKISNDEIIILSLDCLKTYCIDSATYEEIRREYYTLITNYETLNVFCSNLKEIYIEYKSGERIKNCIIDIFIYWCINLEKIKIKYLSCVNSLHSLTEKCKTLIFLKQDCYCNIILPHVTKVIILDKLYKVYDYDDFKREREIFPNAEFVIDDNE